MKFLSRLIVTFLTTVVTAQEANITSYPRSMNISLNGEATFNCTFVGEVLVWEANERQIHSGQNGFEFFFVQLNETQSASLRKSTLTVVASPDRNSTNLTCTAFSSSPLSSKRSETALLLVQGLLESVSNLTVMTMTLINSTTVLISWSPPFTLEGVRILGYNVTITNTTSGENETVLVEDTTLLYSIDHPDPENNFTVTVVPINEVGTGQPATRIFLFSSTPHGSSVSTTSKSISVYRLGIITVTSSIAITPSITVAEFNTTEDNTLISAADMLTILIAAGSGGILAVIIILATATTITCICCLVIHKKRVNMQATLQDVVPVKSNPAYEQVNLKRIEMKKNNAYSTVYLPAAAPQYENAVARLNA